MVLDNPTMSRPRTRVSPQELVKKILRHQQVVKEIESDVGPCGRRVDIPMIEEELHVLVTLLPTLENLSDKAR